MSKTEIMIYLVQNLWLVLTVKCTIVQKWLVVMHSGSLEYVRYFI